MNLIIDDVTRQDISAHSSDLLKACGAEDIYPTPVDRIVEYVGLDVSSKRKLTIDSSYISSNPKLLKRAWQKIQGLLFRQEKKVLIDSNCLPAKQQFVKLHEVGHHVLPWQKAISEIMPDDDQTLDFDVKEKFEAEANMFASETLFQGEKFAQLTEKMPLSIESAINLSDKFGSSIHSSIRRYVEYGHQCCALLVMEKTTQFGALLRNLFHSDSFLANYFPLPFPQVLDVNSYPFVNLYCQGYRNAYKGTFDININGDICIFHYEYFNNSYNGFVLIYA